MTAITFPFPDDAGIQSVALLATELSGALATKRPVRVDLSMVTNPDLSIVQLVSAGRRAAAQAGTDFTLAAPPPPPLAALLERAGFLSGAPDDTAFWLHGDMPR